MYIWFITSLHSFPHIFFLAKQNKAIYVDKPLAFRLIRAYGPTSGSIIKSYNTALHE